MPTTIQNPRVHGVRLQASDPAIDATAYSSGDLTLDYVARGFYPSADGNLIVDFLGGLDGKTPATNITIVVKAGVPFAGFIKKLYNGTVAGTVVY